MTEPVSRDSQQENDYNVINKLLHVTREKLTNAVLAGTELETLLAIEREKSEALQKELDAVRAKDTSKDSK